MYWKYQTITRTGAEIMGTFKGSKDQVLTWLEDKSLKIVYLKPDYSAILKSLIYSKRLSSNVLAEFFDDFQNMYKTGISINEILASLKETTQSDVLIKILEEMEEQLTKGSSLTEAIKSAGYFPWIVTLTIAAGEKAGRLPEVMYVLAEYFKRQAEIKSRILKASVYPIIVLLIMVGVLMYISIYVIPKLENLLPSQALNNYSTRAVLGISVIIKNFWWLILVIPVVLFVLYLKLQNSTKTRITEYYYKFPVIGSIAKESEISIFFLNLAVLQKSGIPILDALNSLYKSNKSYLANKFLVCRDYILGGLSFWEAMGNDHFFPRIIAFTIRKGEEMAKLDEYYMKIADYYSKRVNRKIDTVINLIQPMLLVTCAGFLILIAFSFIGPIYGNLTNIAGGAIK